MILSSPLSQKTYSGLAALLLFTSSLTLVAQGGPTVTINDPVTVTVSGPVSVQGTVGVTGPVSVAGPVSVQGSVGVTGPVSVQGSVGVTGPVSVQGSVGVTGPVSVQGSVGVSGPVEVQGYVEVLNDALKTVFNKRISDEIPANFINRIISLPPIPAGKRLVIEAIGVTALVSPNAKATAFFQGTGIGEGSNALSIPLPLTPQGVFGITPREHYMGLHSMRMVIDPRFTNNPQINVFRSSGATDVSSVTCTILGYLEDIPATQ